GDLAGLDIGYAIRKRRRVERPNMRYPAIADRIVEAGRLGQKTSKGWYRYETGSRTPQVDPDVEAMIENYRHEMGITPRQISDDNEAAHGRRTDRPPAVVVRAVRLAAGANPHCLSSLRGALACDVRCGARCGRAACYEGVRPV